MEDLDFMEQIVNPFVTEKLEQYFAATIATAARKETLTYTQGMKDLFALLKALS